KSHNTIVIDDKDQSEILGSFRFGQTAEVELLEWRNVPGENIVSARHNGYKDVIHTRSIKFNGQDLFIINDYIEESEAKKIDMVFNMNPKLSNLEIKSKGKCICSFDNFKVIIGINVDKALGNFKVEDGWISGEWNQRQENKRLIYSICEELPLNIETKIYIK